jgi:hypothetical protein
LRIWMLPIEKPRSMPCMLVETLRCGILGPVGGKWL